MHQWSKVKDFRRQTKECIAVFFKMCEKCYRKRCKYMRNKFARKRGSKKLQLHNIKVSSTTVWIYMKSKGWKALKRKRRRTCRHGVWRIWKLYSKGDRLANSHDVNPLETIWIIIDEKTYKEPAPKSLDELRQWLRFAWKRVPVDTFWELVHSIRHHLENVRKHKERHSG